MSSPVTHVDTENGTRTTQPRVSHSFPAVADGGLLVRLVNHPVTMADRHRAGRYDQMPGDVRTLTGKEPLTVQQFVRNNAARFTAAAREGFRERVGRKNVTNLKIEPDIAGLVVIDPYYDFISEGGKVSDRIRGVADANPCVPHMIQILDAAQKADVRVSYALHRRYRPGEHETWKYIAPMQKAAWSRKASEYGTWGGEIRREFEPQPDDIVAQEHWCSSGFANTDLDL